MSCHNNVYLNIFTKVHIASFYLHTSCMPCCEWSFVPSLAWSRTRKTANALISGSCGSSKKSRIITFFANIEMIALILKLQMT